MKRLKIICLPTILIIGLLSSLSYGQTKWAQTGFNFLSISSDARAAAMGDAVNSLTGYSGALFHNPATMAEMPTLFTADFSINSWIADIKYLELNMIISPFSGTYGVVGLSLQSVDYGDVLGTMVWNNTQGFVDTEVMNPAALALGIGYAKMLSDRFGVGGQIRFAYQALGKSLVPSGNGLMTKRNVANAVAYDFGTIFKTGIKSLAFGMSIRNFSNEIKFEEEGFQLPLLFTLGISANMFDFMEVAGPQQALILSVDVTHPRSHPEQVKMGMEYQLMNVLALRAGYITSNSEDGVTFGLGVTSAGLGLTSLGSFKVDYSYTPFGVFDNVQRFTVSLSL